MTCERYKEVPTGGKELAREKEKNENEEKKKRTQAKKTTGPERGLTPKNLAREWSLG